MNRVKTFRQLKWWLATLTDEQLDCNTAVEIVKDEIFSGCDGGIRFEIMGEDQILDKNHPVISLRDLF